MISIDGIYEDLLVINKSKFYSFVYPITTEEQAKEYINKLEVSDLIKISYIEKEIEIYVYKNKNVVDKLKTELELLDNELRLSDTNLSHKDWLLNIGVNSFEFEDIPRGYILKLDKNNYKVVSYKGSNFNCCELDNDTILKIQLFIEIIAGDNVKISWFSGVRVGEPGTEWEPIQYIGDTVPSDVKYIRLARLKILKYEELITNLINANMDENIVLNLEIELSLINNLLSGKYKFNTKVADRAYRFSSIIH